MSDIFVESFMHVTHDKTVHVEWELPNFLDQKYSPYTPIDCHSFVLSDVKWCVCFYPRYGENAVLELLKTQSQKELHVSVTIGIKKGDDSVFKSFYYSRLFPEHAQRWRTPQFLSSELFQCPDIVSPNGSLTIFLTARALENSSEDVAAEAACQTLTNGFETLSKDFTITLKEGEGDVTFNVKNRKFFAHKLVLITRSTVFRSMLETDTLKKNDGTINISDSDPDDFEKFLLYLYSGDLDVVSPTNALGLYLLADKYKLKELKETCYECFYNEISVDTFCDIALLAYRHNETELLEKASNFFIEHSNAVISTSKWAALYAEHFALAKELLNNKGNQFLT